MLIAAFVAAFFVSSANAEPNCWPHREVATVLENQANERLVADGRTADGRLLIYASKAGTYSVLILLPPNIACMIAAGTEWRTHVPREWTH